LPRTAKAANGGSVIEETTTVKKMVPEAEPPAPEERPDVFTYMRSLKPAEWDNHIGYLYRLEPSAALPGLGGYLCKFTNPIDVEEIKAKYGGRKFKIMLSRGQTLLYRAEFIIEAPPKLDSTREAAPNGNGSPGMPTSDAASIVREAFGLFREEMKNRMEAEGGQPASNKIVEMMSAASDRAMEMITKQVPPTANPAAQLKDMIGVMKELGIAGGGQNTVVETIKVLKELGVIGGSAVDPTAQLNNMLTIFTKLDDLRATGAKGGHRNGGTDWTGIVERGLEILPGLLQARAAQAPPAAQPVMGRAVPPPQTPPAAPPPRPPAAVATAAAPPDAASPVAAGPLPVIPFDRQTTGQGAAPAEVVAATQEPPAQFTDEQRDNWMASRVVEYVILGYSGAHVIEFLSSIDRTDLIGDIAKYPPPMVTQFFQAHPVLRQATTHARWEAVLAEAQLAAKEWMDEDAAATAADDPKVN
jgi:hypothetical protein